MLGFFLVNGRLITFGKMTKLITFRKKSSNISQKKLNGREMAVIVRKTNYYFLQSFIEN